MSRRMNWEGAARRDQMRRGGPPPRKPKGPSNKQRSYLKALAQQAGEPTPMPKTRQEASAEIDRLKAFLGRTSLGRALPLPAQPRDTGRHRRSRTPQPG